MLSSHIPILPKDLKVYEQSATALLKQVKWKPVQSLTSVAPDQAQSGNTKLWRPSVVIEAKQDEEASLYKVVSVIANDTLLPDSLNKTLRALRTGVEIGFHLANQYCVATGLQELQRLNQTGRLTGGQQEEFRSKIFTSSAIAIYTAAAYVVWELSSFETDKVSKAQVEFHGIPEVNLQSQQHAMKCMLFYLEAYLNPQKGGLIKTDIDAVAMTLKYCAAVMDEIKIRLGSLKYVEFFTNVSYQLADTDFTVQGFEALRPNVVVSVEFNKVRFEEIVGNRAAKHEAIRLAQKLVCYDPKVKKNPFVELGGLQRIRMGHGQPGTGKSMQIAATATLLEEYCQKVGLPFLFWPLPDNIVSTFQGGSAERMLPWMKRLEDADGIVYGSIDDGETNLEDRTRQGVSAGVREVIAVFLRHTEGAYAVNHGNSVIEIFTNLPEQIDAAVMSRIQARFPIPGAQTRNDFLDQDHLWWRKLEKSSPGFVAMNDPKDYEYLLDQKPVKSLSELRLGIERCSDERIQAIIDNLNAKGLNYKDHAFFGALFSEVHKIYEKFTSRDVRNIQQAVSARIMDFDLSPEWFENLDLFFRQEYQVKLEMLRDLMRQNMKGLTFSQIRFEETIRYLDSAAAIANIDRDRRIRAYMESIEIQTEAQRRMTIEKKQ